MGYHRQKIGGKWKMSGNRRNFTQNRRFVLPGMLTRQAHKFTYNSSYKLTDVRTNRCPQKSNNFQVVENVHQTCDLVDFSTDITLNVTAI